MPRQTVISASAPPEATIAAVEDSTSAQVSSTLDPDLPASTTQHHHAENTNEPAPAPAMTESAMEESSQGFVLTSDSNTISPMVESQAVMDASSGTPSTQSIPVSRTGLIRPTFTSNYTRPSDPVATIQPGIAAAIVVLLVGIAVIALILVRRWRRNRTRRRTRSVVDFLNRHQEKNDQENASPTEKTQGKSDVESGFLANNAGVGAHSDPALDQLKPPIVAKTRPGSVKGFNESPFPTTQTGLSSTVKFALPHAPTKPSPLRA